MLKHRTRLRAHLPAHTVRVRLTLSYWWIFLASAAALLLITVALWQGGTTSAVPATGAAGPPHLANAATQHNSDLYQLLVVSGIALAIMAVFSIVLGWLMAERFLRPVRAITATAREISATNLHERLGFAGPHDELKELADTFDDLLARLERSFSFERQFVANASHELRTPLTTMRVWLDVAMAKPEPIPPQTSALADRLRGNSITSTGCWRASSPWLIPSRAQPPTSPCSCLTTWPRPRSRTARRPSLAGRLQSSGSSALRRV